MPAEVVARRGTHTERRDLVAAYAPKRIAHATKCLEAGRGQMPVANESWTPRRSNISRSGRSLQHTVPKRESLPSRSSATRRTGLMKACAFDGKDDRTFLDCIMASANVAKALAPYQSPVATYRQMGGETIDLSRLTDEDISTLEEIYERASEPLAR